MAEGLNDEDESHVLSCFPSAWRNIGNAISFLKGVLFDIKGIFCLFQVPKLQAELDALQKKLASTEEIVTLMGVHVLPV